MRRLLLPLVLLATLLQVGVAEAVESFPVTSTADAGTGSLREAIEAANKAPGADSVPIAVTGTIALESPLPPIVNSLTISGPGADDLTIERKAGAAPFRVLTFAGPLPSVVRDVTISGGLDALGAGILSEAGSLTLIGVVVTDNEAMAEGGGTALASGGGILSQGALTLRESFVFENTATARNGSAETTASGGGVSALGPLTIEESTVAANLARVLGVDVEDALAAGGGILAAGGPTTIDRSTISYNAALAAAGSDTNMARGGGIGIDASGGESRLTSSTLNGNSAATNPTGAVIDSAVGANIQSSTASVLRNTLVSFPQGGPASCAGTISSAGFNLDEGHSCGLDQSTDLLDVSPGLNLSLEDLGGPTPTHALLETSPAVDRGNAFGSTVDQRGLPRPSDFATIGNAEGGDGSDIGAFELQAPPPTAAVQVSASLADRQAPNTRIVSGPPRNSFKRLAKFRFASSEPQSTFQCKVDKGRWRGCSNPFKRKVKAGAKHVFKVRAIDRFGNVDPSPARFGWRVKKIVG